MKKFLLALSLLAVQVGSAHAGEAKLTWGNFDTFSDVQEGRDSRDRFRENLMKEFTDIFNAQAKKLPEGYVLSINVSDLDLAGDIRPSMSSWQIRIMTAIYWPRMNFSYELRNEKAELISSGTEELRDMDYLNRARFPSGVTHFEFEERMVQDWFRRQLAAGSFPGKDGTKVAAQE
jgi:hypothetical protein